MHATGHTSVGCYLELTPEQSASSRMKIIRRFTWDTIMPLPVRTNDGFWPFADLIVASAFGLLQRGPVANSLPVLLPHEKVPQPCHDSLKFLIDPKLPFEMIFLNT
jgi:hypothetical protein